VGVKRKKEVHDAIPSLPSDRTILIGNTIIGSGVPYVLLVNQERQVELPVGLEGRPGTVHEGEQEQHGDGSPELMPSNAPG
jgi:hypothetical protein